MRWAALVVVLGALPAFAAPTPILERVEVTATPAPVVRLQFSLPTGRPVAQALAAVNGTPERVVLDFGGTKLGRDVPRSVPGVPAGPLLQVRSGQFTDTTTRIVLDLTGPTPSTVRVAGRSVTIALSPPPPSPAYDEPAERSPGARSATSSTVVATTTTTSTLRSTTSTVRATTTSSTTSSTTSTSHTTTSSTATSSTTTSSTTTSSTTTSSTTSSSTTSSSTTSSTTSTTSTTTTSSSSTTTTSTTSSTTTTSTTTSTVRSTTTSSSTSTTTSTTSTTTTRPPQAAHDLGRVRAAAQWDRAMVVVDAGHGGRDPGAAGIGGIREKDLTLAIAQRLAEKLAARLPVTAILTRWDDSFVPLGERLPSPDGPPTLFLSLHANASTDPRPWGMEVFFGGDLLRASDVGSPSLRARRFARTLAQTLRSGGWRVRGHPRPGSFAVLTRNPVPGVLLELGYLTNLDDATQLQDAAVQDRLTDAVVDAVAQMLRSGV